MKEKESKPNKEKERIQNRDFKEECTLN